jgi:hypothetical protein
MDRITSTGYDGEGMKRVYENQAWMVGVKNYKVPNDAERFDEIERHRETDELFVLLSGSCSLLAAWEEGKTLRFEAEAMLPGKVYAIPKGLWHTTITVPGTKLVLVEDPRTGQANSDAWKLAGSELEAARRAVAAARK